MIIYTVAFCRATQAHVLLGDDLNSPSRDGAFLFASTVALDGVGRREVSPFRPFLHHPRALSRCLGVIFCTSNIVFQFLNHLHERFPRLGSAFQLCASAPIRV